MSQLAGAAATGVALALQRCPQPRFVLVSDLDHTMVQNEDPTHEKLQLFNRLWNMSFAADSLLVFSTGRSPALFLELWNQTPLLTPNVLICSVGSEIFYRTADGSYVPDAAWERQLDQGWDRAAAQALVATMPQFTPQAATEQRRHKLSYHLKRTDEAADNAIIQDLRSALEGAGIKAKVIYSGGVDVDVLSTGAGKGKALEFVLGQLRETGQWPRDGVQVNGDSGNDAELFVVPGVRGCVVANAHPELMAFYQQAAAAAAGGAPGPAIHLAQQPCAGGIVEALVKFQSVPADGGPAGAVSGTVTQLAMLQSNPQAGAVAQISEPGATWVTPSGRFLGTGHTEQPADAAAKGLTWVDDVVVREVAPGAALATYTLWSMAGSARDSGRAFRCSAVFRTGGAAAGGVKLVHLHESVAAPDAISTAAVAALVAPDA